MMKRARFSLETLIKSCHIQAWKSPLPVSTTFNSLQ